MPAKKTPSTPKAPRRFLRRSLTAIAAVAAFLALASVVAPFFIPWDKVRQEAVAAGSKALGRDLSIDAIDVGLFSGVHLRNLRIANAGKGFSQDALFSNADAKVRVNLFSLLGGTLVIDSITFDQPRFLLETDAKGHTNLEGLGGPPAPSQAAAAPAPGASATVGGKRFPAVLLSLVVKDGDVVVRDRRDGSETALHGVNLDLEGLSLAAAGASRLTASLTAVVQGKPIPLHLDSAFRLDLPHDRLTLERLAFTAPAVEVDASGTVQNLSAPDLDLSVAATVDAAHLDALLPPSALAQWPDGLKASGGVSLDAHLKGSAQRPAALDVAGSLRFDKLTLADGAYPAFGDIQGTLRFDRAGLDLPSLDFTLGGDPANFALSARWGDLSRLLGPRGALQAQIRYALRSPRLNLDPLLAAGSGATTTAAAAQPAAAQGASGLPDYTASVPRGLSVDGTLDLGGLKVQGYTTGKLVQHLTLKDRVVVSATDLELYGGRIYERSRADFNRPGPPFASTLGVAGLDFGKLVDAAAAAKPGSALAHLQGKLSGTFSTKAVVQGRGFAKPYVLDNTRADVTFSLQQGVLRRTDLQDALAGVLPYPKVQDFLRSDLRFANAVGQAQYAARRVVLRSFALGSGSNWRGGDLFLQAVGTYTLDGPVDLKVEPHFAPALGLFPAEIAGALKDTQGWPTLDYIGYAGPTLGAAKPDVTALLQRTAKRLVGQKVDQAKQAVTHAATQAIQQKAGGLLKQLPGGLNGLFGH